MNTSDTCRYGHPRLACEDATCGNLSELPGCALAPLRGLPPACPARAGPGAGHRVLLRPARCWLLLVVRGFAAVCCDAE